MKQVFVLLLSIILFTATYSQNLTASINKVKLVFSLNEKGEPVYAVSFNDKPVIKPSQMGFVLSNNNNFSNNFELTGSDTTSKDTTWKPVWGEVKEIRDHYKQLTVHLKQKSSNRLLDIVFRVFADGVGFRYEFPLQTNLKYFIVSDELTQFTMAGDHKTFWIPGDYDSNEYPYTTSKLSEINNKQLVENSTAIAVRVAPDSFAVQTPLMMKSDDGLYINIHEAALVNYPAMQLHIDHASLILTSSLVPDAVGNKAYLHAPSHTPWRTIIVSDKAADILSSKIILNLNEPSAIANTSWITPMKFVGVWWEMQTGKGTWSYANNADDKDANGNLIPSGKHSANTTNVKRYIDFVSANNIKGVWLKDGIQVGKIGLETGKKMCLIL